MNQIDISPRIIQEKYGQLKSEAESAGYHLNPDEEIVKCLVHGLLENERRYGYQACPCRLASGKKEEDLDIICPCDYRDPDLGDFGACYCALYVSEDILNGTKNAGPIPERRPPSTMRKKQPLSGKQVSIPPIPFPIWRCRVCGYICARDSPPLVCPICKAKSDRFERFIG